MEVEPNEWVFWEPTLTNEVETQFDLALDVHESGDRQAATTLLRTLVMKYPNHIDALHHLSLWYGEEGKTLESYTFCQAAVSVGLHAIPKRFSWDRGKLSWLDIRNRPFMRAYDHLGFLRIDQGHWNDALNIFMRLLTVNPSDNQGIRYMLPKCWFETGEISTVIKHCRKYSDDSAPEIRYSNVLALVLDGRENDAEAALADCIAGSPLVAKELLKKRHPLPKSRHPGLITIGGEDQAWVYWKEYGQYWDRSQSAMALLREVASTCARAT